MKHIIIADTVTLTNDGKIYGHFPKVAKQYFEILKKVNTVKIAGGNTYKSYFSNEDLIQLPYEIKYEESRKVNSRIFREFYNARKILSSNNDVVIFQCLHEVPIYLALLFGCRPKVCMIQYQKGLHNKLKKCLYNLVKRKISGIIASSESVGKFYNRKYIVLPDYFPLEDTNEEKIEEFKYDGVMLGTISNGKNYEDVIKSFSNTEYKILIAGKFNDVSYYNRLKEISTSNIEIINKYLTDEEYDNILKKSKFVILPYKKSYDEKGSGVLLEALYSLKPVIVSNLKTFKIVQEKGMGLVYNESISEVINKIKENDYYNYFINNVKKFKNDSNNKANELINFIENM